jgi:hypothetical protein
MNYGPGSTTNMPWYLANCRDANHARLEAERDEARKDAAESWRLLEKAIFERTEGHRIACQLLTEKQMLEAERDMAQGSGDYADVAALIDCIQEVLDKNQPRRFSGAQLRLPMHLRQRIKWPGG